MGIRSNKVGGDIKGKRERKCEFLERCLILKSLIKRKKKKMSKGSEPWETQLNTLIHFFPKPATGFCQQQPHLKS